MNLRKRILSGLENYIFRFIDDLNAINDAGDIYPEELELGKENSSNLEASYLDLDLKVKLGCYIDQVRRLLVRLVHNQRVSSSDNQHQFRDFLLRLRNGESTVKDWQLLCTRNFNIYPKEYIDQFVTKLAYSNEKVAIHNYEMLKKLMQPIYTIKARHNSSKASKLPSEEYGGLEPLMHLSVGSSVMLTRNLWIEKGLCNGSTGKVFHVIYKNGQQPPFLPVAVLVKFDSYVLCCVASLPVTLLTKFGMVFWGVRLLTGVPDPMPKQTERRSPRRALVCYGDR